MVGMAFDELFDAFDMTLDYQVRNKDKPTPARLREVDLILVNAEGSLHHGRYPHMLDFMQDDKLAAKTVVMNGSYEALTPKQLKLLAKAKLVTARESMSAQYLNNNGVKALVVPDVCLSLELERPQTPVVFSIGYFDSVVNPMLASIPISDFDTYLYQAARYGTWYTGRFHGICLAVLWDVPFYAYGSNTWKNQGIMRDLDLGYIYRDDWKDLLGARRWRGERGSEQYLIEARARIAGLFEQLQ